MEAALTNSAFAPTSVGVMPERKTTRALRARRKENSMRQHYSTRRHASFAVVVGLALLCACAQALAQGGAFPQRGKPITLIVPYAGGGVTDTGARLMAAGLEKELNTPV